MAIETLNDVTNGDSHRIPKNPSLSFFKHRKDWCSPCESLCALLQSPCAPETYYALRDCLKDPKWAQKFLKEHGVTVLLDTLNSLDTSRGLDDLKAGIEQCLSLVMDSRVGLDYIVENVDYTQKLATALDTDNVTVKKQIFELLSALCVYSTEGYTRALETLQHYKTLKKQRYRFQMVVEELKSTELEDYTTALVAFVNCVIISEATLNNRIRIRNEFLGLKILEVLDRFRKQCKNDNNPELALQLDVFDEQRSTDEGQFSGPDGVDLSSHMDVFFAILRQIAQTPQELPFLSILQHLLRTDINQPLSEVVWETAETLVHRATLLESKQESDRLLRASSLGGLFRCHCSCHYKTTSVEDGLTPKRNRPNHLPLCSTDGARTPSLILSPNQQNLALTPCDSTSSPLFCVVNDVFRSPNKGSSLKENPVPTVNKQFEKDMPFQETLRQGLSPKSCLVQSLSSINQSSEVTNAQSQPPPPPPPPPPPLPPPPFLGRGIPGIPPPPPSLPMKSETKVMVPESVHLPQQDTPKPKTKMKSFNWSKIPAYKVVGRDNLWSRVAKEHSGSPNDLDFEVMEGLFCQQPVQINGYSTPKFGGSTPDSADGGDRKKKEIQEINLLDGKRSLNINIFLKQFRSSHQEIVRILKEGAHEDLGAERLRGLLKILPEDDEVEMLRNFYGEKAKLGNAEKFLLQLLGVPSYKLRIESMLLKEEFLGSQEFLETSIETVRCAAQEIEECKKLHEIFYMVLVAGNFLNAGGYAGDAAGFKILSLLKLTDIRANKPSMTLIHYVAEQAVEKKPDLLTLLDEVRSLEEASKISIETLKTDMSSLSQRVSKISSQVSTSEPEIKSQMQDFLLYAENKVETIQNEINNLENVRHKLEEFLCEDKDAFKLEDCFKVIHSFCKRFKAAVQENEKRRQQEKLAETRRKQREEQIALKRRSLELSDTRSNGDVDHIMDQLLGDIRSGFPERRLGELYKKNKRNSPDQDATSRNEIKAKSALKRHSDPSMADQGDLSDEKQDRATMGIVRQRRARFMDDSDELIGYLKNPESEGVVDDGGVDRGMLRRSGRRKRELVNTKTTARERATTSPPPAAEEETETEISSKQKLRAKINDWLVQNELEHQRDKELQLKKLANERLRKQQLNGHVVNTDKVCSGNGEGVEGKANVVVVNHVSDLPVVIGSDLKLAQETPKRQSDFTQKIIGLLDATSNEKKPFERTRLYHSTKELSSRKKFFDDPEIKGSVEAPKKSDCDHVDDDKHRPVKESLAATKSEDVPGTFDRFSSTRKTQRRLKLREMRIEGENKLKLRLSSENQNGKEDKTEADMASSSSPVSDSIASKSETVDSMDSVGHSDNSIHSNNQEWKNNSNLSSPNNDEITNCRQSVSDSSQHNDVIREGLKGLSHGKEATNNIKILSDQTLSMETNDCDQHGMTALIQSDHSSSTDSRSFADRPRSTSLRSRQSRLARRIDSLTTPVTSPSELKVICEGENLSVKQHGDELKGNEEIIQAIITQAGNDGSDQVPVKSSTMSSDVQKQEAGDTAKDQAIGGGFEPSTSAGQTGVKSPKPPDIKGINKTGKLANGHVSHKVTVCTETKSKVTIPNRSTISQNAKVSKPATKTTTSKNSTTNIPGILRTTQNVKISQTIQTRSPQLSSKRSSNEPLSKVISNRQPVNGNKSPTVLPSTASPRSSLRQSNTTVKKGLSNGKGTALAENNSSFRRKKPEKCPTSNGHTTPTSVSSLDNLNINDKTPKIATDGQPKIKSIKSNITSEKKVTINHKGPIKLNSKGSNKISLSESTNKLKHSLPTKCSTVPLCEKKDAFSLTRKTKLVA